MAAPSGYSSYEWINDNNGNADPNNVVTSGQSIQIGFNTPSVLPPQGPQVKNFQSGSDYRALLTNSNGNFILTQAVPYPYTIVDDRTTTNPPTNADYRSALDYGTCDIVSGWAFDRNNPNQSITVDVYINGTLAQSALPANNDRQDVANAFGTSYNKYGFSWNVPASYRTGTALTISVKYGGTTIETSDSPKTTATCPGTPTTCNFNLSASTSTPNISCNQSGQLSFNCTGPDCTGASFNWSGNGLNQAVSSGQTISTGQRSTNGSFTYTLTATKGSCQQAANATITVSGCGTGGGGDYEGHFDTADCNSLNGWVYDRNNPNAQLTVELFSNGVSVGTYLAGNFRPDLQNAGKGNGQHGFSVATPNAVKTSQNQSLTMRVAGQSYQLANAWTINCPGTPTTCNVNLSASTSTPNISCNQSGQLSFNCTGPDCTGASFNWSGNGLNQAVSSGQTISTGQRSTNGSFTYTLTATKGSCQQAANATITVSGCGGGPQPNYASSFDGADCNTISGWAFDRTSPNQSITVDIYVNGQLAQGGYPATATRQDVANAYGTSFSQYGFYWSLPSNYKNGSALNVSVKYGGTGQELTGGPKTTGGCTARIGVEPESADESGLQISPNPSSGRVLVGFRLGAGEAGSLVVQSLTGSVLQSRAVVGTGAAQEETLDLEGQASGLYVVRLVGSTQNRASKLLLIR